MGKKLRQTNVSGLSSFLQTFDEPSLSPTTSSTSIAGPSTRPLTLKSDSVDFKLETQPAAGLRKTGLLGPGKEAYDVTGLVPFYTDASQAPAHLQKCACIARQRRLTVHRHLAHPRTWGHHHRFRTANALLFEVRRGMFVRRGRVVQHNA